MSEANMIAAINVSSMANRLFFNGLLFDPAWMGFHELAPEQEDDDGCEQQVDDRKIKEVAGVALVRLWFLAPGDICREC
jgi:hypothetical protein